MDERMQFVASRRADGGTLQRVWHLPQDRLQDLQKSNLVTEKKNEKE
jgi:hypothetical protein